MERRPGDARQAAWRRVLTDPVALVLLGAAALTRFWGLGTRGFWVDEAFTAHLAGTGAARAIDMLHRDSGPPLYYLVLQLWSQIAGRSELALRVPSALAGVATVALAMVLARRLSGSWGSWLTGFLFLVAPVLVHHAQEARYYAFLPLLSLTGVLLLERAIEAASVRRWVAYAALLVVAAYVHTYGLLLIPAGYAYVMAAVRTGRRLPASPWPGLHGASAGALVAWAPWAPVLLAQIRFGGTEWAASHFDAAAPLRSLEAWLPGGKLPPFIAMVQQPGLRVPAIVLGIALAAACGWALARKALARRRALPLVAHGALAAILVYLPSLLGAGIYVVAKGDLLFAPPIVLAVALAVAGLSRRWLLALVGVPLAALSGVVLSSFYRHDLKSGDRDAARYVVASAGSGDVVVASGLAWTPLTVYLERARPSLRAFAFPPDMPEHPGNFDPERARRELEASLRGLDEELSAHRASGPAGAVWAVLSPGPVGQSLGRYLDERLTRSGRAPEAVFRMGVLGTPLEIRRYHWPADRPPAEVRVPR